MPGSVHAARAALSAARRAPARLVAPRFSGQGRQPKLRSLRIRTTVSAHPSGNIVL